jgi:hypothetical protein
MIIFIPISLCVSVCTLITPPTLKCVYVCLCLSLASPVHADVYADCFNLSSSCETLM